MNKGIPARIVLLAFMATFAASAQALSSVTISGKLVSKSTQVTIPSVSDAIANVKPVTVQFQQGANPGCKVTTNMMSAMNHSNNQGDLLCYFEWILPTGMSAAGDEATGYLASGGDHPVGYSISIFSGVTREKVLVETGQTIITATPPEPPSIDSFYTVLTSNSGTGVVTSYRRGDLVERVRIAVKPRPYNQRVILDAGGSCEVLAGTTHCDVVFSNMPVTNTEDAQGLTGYSVGIDSFNSYFSSIGTPFNYGFDIAWDYRPASVTSFNMQAVIPGNEELIVKDVEGTSFVLGNEKAMLIVKSPHSDLPGSWWHPSSTLRLKPDPEYKIEVPSYEIGGEDLLNLGDLVSLPSGDVLLNPTTVSRVNGNFVFEYALNAVPDGVYYAEANINDSYNNSWKGDVSNSTPLDRKPPEIRLFRRNGKVLKPSDPVYFFEDILIGAVDSLSGAGEILRATVDGNDVLAAPLQEGLVHVRGLEAAALELEPNQSKTLLTVVRDMAGNTTTKEIELNYMPVEFTLNDRNAEYRQRIQDIEFPILREKGPACRMFDSVSSAQARSGIFGYRCAVEWVGTPSGTSGVWDGRQPVLRGTFSDITEAEGSNTALYKLWFVNEDGVAGLAYRGEQQFNVTPPDSPIISVNTYRAAAEDLFVTTTEGGYLTSTAAEFNNADLTYKMDVGDAITTYEHRQSGFAGKKNRLSRSLTVGPAPLWTERFVKLSANYNSWPEVNSERSVRVVHAPPLSVRGVLETDEVVQTNIDNVEIRYNFGIRNNRTREYEYDPSTMGEWQVKLAREERQRDGTYIYTDLTPVTALPVEGKIAFNISLEEFVEGSHRIVALSEVVSPIADVTRSLTSNAVYYRVYKGTAIDGEINTRRISGRVPFNVRTVFSPETKEDRQSKGLVTWEISKDEGATWESVIEGRDYASVILEEAGLYQIRAKVANKYTGVERYTEIQEVLAYNQPKLTIDGPVALHEGEQGSLVLSDGDYEASNDDATIEWSLDGETWEEGTSTYDFTMGGDNLNFWVRMAYDGNEMAGDDQWGKAQIRVRKARMAPVRISIQPDRLMEQGQSYTYHPMVRLVDTAAETPIKGYWVLPSGEIVDGIDLTYSPTEDDVLSGSGVFQFFAWAEGFSNETKNVYKFTPKMWKYEFPSYELLAGTKTPYAPAFANISLPRPTDLPPTQSGITYKTTWELPDSAEVIRQDDSRSYVNMTEAGVHRVRAVIEDSRGNVRAYETFVSLDIAPEPDFVIAPRYSNVNMREPLMVTARLNGKLGHPLDRVDNVQWQLNGQVIQGETGTSALIQNIQAGQHTITAVMNSKMGVTRTYNFPLFVVDNIAPTCESMTQDYPSFLKLQIVCDDPDGRIARYVWSLDGQIIPYSGSYMNVSKLAGVTADIVVYAVDDGGEESNVIEKSYSH